MKFHKILEIITRLRPWQFSLISAIFALVVVSVLSLIFHNRVTLDYLITGFITSILVSYSILRIIYVYHEAYTKKEQLVRKQAEEEREKLIKELEHKNAELERFTYTVSHDLRSPLVTIKGFLSVILEDHRAGKSDRIEAFVTRVLKAADKMNQLFEDLLQLSRLERLDNQAVCLSLSDLLKDVIELLHGKITEHNITITIEDDLPSIIGNEAQIHEVFQNLIENAIKFMGGQKKPTIKIGGKGDGNFALIYIRDNGIGINPKYQERIFGLFNQLDKKIAGTGIGLSLVKRIIEIHNGKIWVASDGLNKGSTFYFTLPGG